MYKYVPEIIDNADFGEMVLYVIEKSWVWVLDSAPQ
jgi:hypothetical protein